jgi:hypothetical protein
MNVSPEGQRRSVDQNPPKRSDLDDLESPAVASHLKARHCFAFVTANSILTFFG